MSSMVPSSDPKQLTPAAKGEFLSGMLVELNRMGRYGYVQAAHAGRQYVFIIGQALKHVQSIGLQIGDELRFLIGAQGQAEFLEVAPPSASSQSVRGGSAPKKARPAAREHLSDAEVQAIRQVDLAALPRIGTRKIESQAQLVQSVEGIAFALASFREELYQEGHPNWWHLADLLDTTMDVLDALPELMGSPVDSGSASS